jgi:hypothetical protein
VEVYIKYIAGYEGFYSASECGRIFSHKRNRFLKGSTSHCKRYITVTICMNGIPKVLMVHRAVAIAFIDNPDNKPEVNHKDGDRLNNCVDNLEWCTRSENMKHAYATGLHKTPPNAFKPGRTGTSRNDKSKLGDAEVIEIRERYRGGETFRSIANDYPLDESSIRRCCKRQSYKDII